MRIKRNGKRSFQFVFRVVAMTVLVAFTFNSIAGAAPYSSEMSGAQRFVTQASNSIVSPMEQLKRVFDSSLKSLEGGIKKLSDIGLSDDEIPEMARRITTEYVHKLNRTAASLGVKDVRFDISDNPGEIVVIDRKSETLAPLPDSWGDFAGTPESSVDYIGVPLEVSMGDRVPALMEKTFDVANNDFLNEITKFGYGLMDYYKTNPQWFVSALRNFIVDRFHQQGDESSSASEDVYEDRNAEEYIHNLGAELDEVVNNKKSRMKITDDDVARVIVVFNIVLGLWYSHHSSDLAFYPENSDDKKGFWSRANSLAVEELLHDILAGRILGEYNRYLSILLEKKYSQNPEPALNIWHTWMMSKNPETAQYMLFIDDEFESFLRYLHGLKSGRVSSVAFDILLFFGKLTPNEIFSEIAGDETVLFDEELRLFLDDLAALFSNPDQEVSLKDVEQMVSIFNRLYGGASGEYSILFFDHLQANSFWENYCELVSVNGEHVFRIKDDVLTDLENKALKEIRDEAMQMNMRLHEVNTESGSSLDSAFANNGGFIYDVSPERMAQLERERVVEESTESGSEGSEVAGAKKLGNRFWFISEKGIHVLSVLLLVLPFLLVLPQSVFSASSLSELKDASQSFSRLLEFIFAGGIFGLLSMIVSSEGDDENDLSPEHYLSNMDLLSSSLERRNTAIEVLKGRNGIVRSVDNFAKAFADYAYAKENWEMKASLLAKLKIAIIDTIKKEKIEDVEFLLTSLESSEYSAFRRVAASEEIQSIMEEACAVDSMFQAMKYTSEKQDDSYYTEALHVWLEENWIDYAGVCDLIQGLPEDQSIKVKECLDNIMDECVDDLYSFDADLRRTAFTLLCEADFHDYYEKLDYRFVYWAMELTEEATYDGIKEAQKQLLILLEEETDAYFKNQVRQLRRSINYENNHALRLRLFKGMTYIAGLVKMRPGKIRPKEDVVWRVIENKDFEVTVSLEDLQSVPAECWEPESEFYLSAYAMILEYVADNNADGDHKGLELWIRDRLVEGVFSFSVLEETFSILKSKRNAYEISVVDGVLTNIKSSFYSKMSSASLVEGNNIFDLLYGSLIPLEGVGFYEKIARGLSEKSSRRLMHSRVLLYQYLAAIKEHPEEIEDLANWIRTFLDSHKRQPFFNGLFKMRSIMIQEFDVDPDLFIRKQDVTERAAESVLLHMEDYESRRNDQADMQRGEGTVLRFTSPVDLYVQTVTSFFSAMMGFSSKDNAVDSQEIETAILELEDEEFIKLISEIYSKNIEVARKTRAVLSEFVPADDSSSDPIKERLLSISRKNKLTDPVVRNRAFRAFGMWSKFASRQLRLSRLGGSNALWTLAGALIFVPLLSTKAWSSEANLYVSNFWTYVPFVFSVLLILTGIIIAKIIRSDHKDNIEEISGAGGGLQNNAAENFINILRGDNDGFKFFWIEEMNVLFLSDPSLRKSISDLLQSEDFAVLADLILKFDLRRGQVMGFWDDVVFDHDVDDVLIDLMRRGDDALCIWCYCRVKDKSLIKTDSDDSELVSEIIALEKNVDDKETDDGGEYLPLVTGSRFNDEWAASFAGVKRFISKVVGDSLELPELVNVENINALEDGTQSIYSFYRNIFGLNLQLSEEGIKNEYVRGFYAAEIAALLMLSEKYDLEIAEVSNTDNYLLFARKFASIYFYHVLNIDIPQDADAGEYLVRLMDDLDTEDSDYVSRFLVELLRNPVAGDDLNTFITKFSFLSGGASATDLFSDLFEQKCMEVQRVFFERINNDSLLRIRSVFSGDDNRKSVVVVKGIEALPSFTTDLLSRFPGATIFVYSEDTFTDDDRVQCYSPDDFTFEQVLLLANGKVEHSRSVSVVSSDKRDFDGLPFEYGMSCFLARDSEGESFSEYFDFFVLLGMKSEDVDLKDAFTARGLLEYDGKVIRPNRRLLDQISAVGILSSDVRDAFTEITNAIKDALNLSQAQEALQTAA